jgi:hypothetical protein
LRAGSLEKRRHIALPPDEIAGLYSYGILYGRQAVPESIINRQDIQSGKMLFKSGTLETSLSCKSSLPRQTCALQQGDGSINIYVLKHNYLYHSEDSKVRKSTYLQSVAKLQPLVNHRKSVPKQRLDYTQKSFLRLFLPPKLKRGFDVFSLNEILSLLTGV